MIRRRTKYPLRSGLLPRLLGCVLLGLVGSTTGCTIDVPVHDSDARPTPDGAVSSECPETAHIAASCSLADIQAAADDVEAAGGGAVCVPSGTCTHDESLKLADGISLYGAGEGETVITDADFRVAPAFYGDLGLPFRITGFSLVGDVGLSVRGCQSFRLDHLTLESDATATLMEITESSRGLLDHLTINASGGQTCLYVSQGYEVTATDWVSDVGSLLGSADAIFLEDSELLGCGKGVQMGGHGQLVVRHNTFRGSETSDVHLAGPGHGPPCGARLAEIYNNLFEDVWGVWSSHSLLGGAALIYDNTFRDYDNGVGFHLDSQAQDHPAAMRPHDVWIWDNSFVNLGAGHSDSCPGDWQSGNTHCNEVWVWDTSTHPGLTSAEEIQVDRDYFLRAPTPGDDGVDYTPSPYPHAFTVDGLDLP